MLTKLKKTIQSVLSTEARVLHKAGLTPNMVSALGVILGIISGISYQQAGTWLIGLMNFNYRFMMLLAVLTLLASGFCDALDGAIARLHGETSIFGGFMDSLLDRYVEAAIYCGIILGGLADTFWGLIALIGSLLTSYTRARSEASGVLMETIGIIERPERLLIIAGASIINLIVPEILVLKWSMVFLAIATNTTVIQRVIYFRKKTKIQKDLPI